MGMSEGKGMYRLLVRPIFFSMQPECAHDLMRAAGKIANKASVSRFLQSRCEVSDPRLAATVAGIVFQNPIGLAAGLDKNAELLGLWNGLGFGHVELGTVTALAQPGNPKPRIFRLTADEALINRMGFPSEGADLVQKRLELMKRHLPGLPPLGINIGKSKVTDIEDAIADYRASFVKLAPLVDYVTVNVSSPNTPGLRQLQERDRLLALLRELQSANTSQKPIFVKVAPDLTFEAIGEVVDCCAQSGVAGLIATNTTISREGLSAAIDEAGGLSGAPLTRRALEVVSFIGRCIRETKRGPLALVGVGGISSYEHVLDMLGAGADLVQIYTGLIYKGPGIVKSLNSGLVKFMDRHRCSSLREAANIWKENSPSR